MKTHTARSGTDRTVCGRPISETTLPPGSTERPTCKMCAAVEHTEVIGLLSYELAAALEDAHWLGEADRASVALARRLAQRLDRGDLEPRDEIAAARQLTAIYRALGLSPDGRDQQPTQADTGPSPLRAIRDASARGA